MKTFFKHFIIIGLLTLFTQIGGVLYLLALPIFYWVNKQFNGRWKKRFFKIAFFTAFYLAATFFIVPPLAKWQCGRVPLPLWSNPNLKPHNVFYYCLLNHHYVKPTMKKAAEEVADQLAKKFPGTTLCYLDANFPFFDGYPLEPHFSHRDGKKLDISLHWKNADDKSPIFGNPSFYGYGACAEPLPGEYDTEPICRGKGNWYRQFEKIGTETFFDKNDYIFDEERSKEMIRLFANHPSIGKILLEPHLKTRLGLTKYNKIRFQGCKAARHDDHIHVQL